MHPLRVWLSSFTLIGGVGVAGKTLPWIWCDGMRCFDIKISCCLYLFRKSSMLMWRQPHRLFVAFLCIGETSMKFRDDRRCWDDKIILRRECCVEVGAGAVVCACGEREITANESSHTHSSILPPDPPQTTPDLIDWSLDQSRALWKWCGGVMWGRSGDNSATAIDDEILISLA